MFRCELCRTVDWSRIGREDYLLAMERSPVRDLEIKALLGQALSDDLHSVALLARSVDASYAYEGYDAYRAEELGSRGLGRRAVRLGFSYPIHACIVANIATIQA